MTGKAQLPSKEFGLTDKQYKFCLEYIKDYNGTRAALAAGYPETSARQIATENLSKPAIVTGIQAIGRKVKEDGLVSLEFVINGLRDNAVNAALDGQYSSSNRAYELLGKHLGTFRDRIEVEGQVTFGGILDGLEVERKQLLDGVIDVKGKAVDSDEEG